MTRFFKHIFPHVVVLVSGLLGSFLVAGENYIPKTDSSVGTHVLQEGVVSDSIHFYERSIRWSEKNEDKLRLIDAALAYSVRERDTLAWFTFRLAKATLDISRGDYLKAFDSTLLIEQQVAEYANRRSVISQGEIYEPFSPESKEDSLWTVLHVKSAVQLAEAEVYLNEVTEASNVILAVMSMYSRDSSDLVAGRCYNAMGAIMAHRNQLSLARSYYRRALDCCSGKVYVDQLATIYLNLSSVNIVMRIPGQALQYALDCYSMLNKYNYKGEKYIYTLFQMGVSYRDLGKYNLAEDYLDAALREAETRGYDHLAVYVRSNYITYLLVSGQYVRAESMALVNLDAARHIDHRRIQEVSALQLAQVYDLKGDCQKALQFLDTAYMISKDLALKSEEIRMGYHQRLFSNYKKEQGRMRAAQDLALANAKLQNRNLWTGISVFSGLLLLLGIFLLYRRLQAQRRVNQLIEARFNESASRSKDEMVQREEGMQQELDSKEKELASMALHFVKVEGLVELMEERVQALKMSRSLSGSDQERLVELESMLKELSPDKNWSEFELYFQKVDQDFFHRLDQHYPDLTPNERRLCALIRLNLTSKEISSITARTYSSVNTAKTRLKVKLGCSKDQTLYDVLSRL